MEKPITIQVYGAEVICASCANAPSSRDTFEWIEAALARKFPGQPFSMQYIDIFNPPDKTEERAFAQKVLDEDLFYPVITADGRIISEGNPPLKKIFAVMEAYGYTPVKEPGTLRKAETR
ncbi:YuzD family protein [Heyndrickxia acidiproducens]|jgi:disulfide oxidoreductase YuzD|uniref:YuzD family protein n=1 Tax=Heyndrickxia acidiproducens TaxID=1121084 RepID=UPI00037173DF|nr:YuzD family protein [Heyndrickxia acidiproducens]